MARQLITDEQWRDARELWESDDRISHAEVAKSIGCSKQAVQKKAATQGWKKSMNLQKVVNQAYRRADRSASDKDLQDARKPAIEDKHAGDVVGADKKETWRMEVDAVDTPLLGGMQGEEEAIRRRAEILARHRKEVNAVRNVIYTAIRDKDFNLGKVGKINSEALQIVQNMERKAWGLDAGNPEGGQVVIIDRS